MAWIRWLFLIAAFYDFAIGAAFVGFGPQIFDWAGVPPPNHWGYIEFAALMLVIFGVMFFEIATDPQRYRGMILYGMMLKLSYIGVVGYHWWATGVPWLFQPFVMIDTAMFVLFGIAYVRLAAAAVAGKPT